MFLPVDTMPGVVAPQVHGNKPMKHWSLRSRSCISRAVRPMAVLELPKNCRNRDMFVDTTEWHG